MYILYSCTVLKSVELPVQDVHQFQSLLDILMEVKSIPGTKESHKQGSSEYLESSSVPLGTGLGNPHDTSAAGLADC